MDHSVTRLNLLKLALLPICLLALASVAGAGNYHNFRVAVYARAYEVQQMKDPAWLEARWASITNGLRVDKIYLETHRDGVIPDQETLNKAKEFFKSKGVETAGGIATVVNERNHFETFVYTNPEHRKKLQEIVEYTARNFDEIIVDDFFFTSSKTDSDIQAKGDKTWTRFRLDLMAVVSRDLLVGPAKKVNPGVKVVIKYPNWYEHFQYTGYNLEDEPRIFDGVYTGAETRDPVRGNQHLQQYLGYDLFRYLENIKPGGNGGGWVDTGGWRDKERYGEQLWVALFAKAPEITLFDFRQLLAPVRDAGQSLEPNTIPGYAGSVFEQVDSFLGKLGRPIGVKSYKPYHSSGEDFLHDFIGMLGIPLEMVPAFPTDAPTVLLTESAKFDPAIVSKMKKQLLGGKKVVITSGLLKALQGKGIEDISEIECTDQKATIREFPGRGSARSESDIVIPEIRYPTNDAWEIVTSATKGLGYPIMLQASYGKGQLYVLTIPDNPGDLYNLPPQVLTQIRTVVSGDLPVLLDGPSQTGLFLYDNHKFIVENFAAPGGSTVTAKAVADRKYTKLVDVVSGQQISGQASGDKMVFELTIPPASYRVFSTE
jgi:hypothetical protein